MAAQLPPADEILHQLRVVHPAVIQILGGVIQVGDIYKDADPLVGVDFIMEDARVPWQEQERCGVIECNSLPFIDLHHYPLYGEPRNVAGALWDIVFPGSASRLEARRTTR